MSDETTDEGLSLSLSLSGMPVEDAGGTDIESLSFLDDDIDVDGNGLRSLLKNGEVADLSSSLGGP